MEPCLRSVACDMPRVSSEFLRALLAAAEASGGHCLAPFTSRNLNTPQDLNATHDVAPGTL